MTGIGYYLLVLLCRHQNKFRIGEKHMNWTAGHDSLKKQFTALKLDIVNK